MTNVPNGSHNQSTLKTWKVLGWGAVVIGLPQIYFLGDLTRNSDYYSGSFDSYPALVIADSIALLLNLVFVALSLVAAIGIGKKWGRVFAFLTATSWLLGAVIFTITYEIWYQIDLKNSWDVDWHDTAEHTKYLIGLAPTDPTFEQFIALAGTASAIIWMVIGISCKSTGMVYATMDPHVSQLNQYLSSGSGPRVDLIAQSQVPVSSFRFCGSCGTAIQSIGSQFCSSCGARI